MSTFAIGDIHGCYTALDSLLQVVAPSEEDTVVFLGDYVDRGPNSAHVIEYLFNYDRSELVLLRGNHEIMMMDFRQETPNTSRWLQYGGSETLASYGVKYSAEWPMAVPESHWQLLEATLSYHETSDFIFVHAGAQAGVDMEEQTPQTLFWDKIIDPEPEPYSEDKKVICGHTAQKNGMVADFGHTICIDTYTYGGQWLTCLDVDWGQYWQANQKGQVRKGQLMYKRI